MTNPNGWPGKPGVPLNPERAGAHWLRRKGGGLEAWTWDPDADGCGTEYSGAWQEAEGDGHPDHMARWMIYEGPCLTPAEVEEKVSRLRRQGQELVKEAFEEAARRYPNQAEAQIAFIHGALSWGVPTAEDMSWASDAIRKLEQETPND